MPRMRRFAASSALHVSPKEQDRKGHQGDLASMTDHAAIAPHSGRSLTSYIYDPKFRGIMFQAIALIVIVTVGWWIFDNTTENLQRANTASGYQFLNG